MPEGKRDGCFRWFPCPFCWLERRHQKKMLRRGYWPKAK